MVGDAGNAPVRHFQRYFTTTDLQSARWIITLGKIVNGELMW
jgi:hypothetical protein